ncbi:pentulose and hexulose kinase [Saccharata proteae CBS 121410]|uniref:Xylulose kinase n=1 Tax=Saccharata proteae CBS 121410 TaxID=1314787 RepID=A0A9P4HWD3_9PEZI|nr:pentulose and hexulose kinase [Saccharata proteae CBS 121410]
MTTAQDLYMGFDLSTQQCKCLVVSSDLVLQHEAKVDFDADLSKYGIKKGVLSNPAEGEIYAPVAMWLEAVDLVLARLRDAGLDFSRVKGVCGAGMQHGTVFWGEGAEEKLEGLTTGKSLIDQLGDAFAHPDSPNWQDASTQDQCDRFDAFLGSPEKLAEVTGSKAHHRFSGPQILRFREKYPDHYKVTSRISLVSSFLASLFLGKVAPIDIGDVCGMNLWHIYKGEWHEDLLSLVAGGKEHVAELRHKLGPVPEDGGGSLGSISSYFVEQYGFSKNCAVIPFTGDNPSTILALPLHASDAIVSLGTSTTFLMSTPTWKPDPAYHFFNHPTTAGLYMFMLCYKNGGLAREYVRDDLNQLSKNASSDPHSWNVFNSTTESTPIAGQQSSDTDPMRLGLFFPLPEIVPNVPAGTWRYLYNKQTGALTPATASPDSKDWPTPQADARAILESQFLSLRLRSAALVSKQPDPNIPNAELPPQPRRIYLVGGGSANPTIARVCGEVLGGAEGVYRLDIGSNACALGACYKACWGVERKAGETFEELVESRWDEGRFVKRITDGYRRGVYERYGEAVKGFDTVEKEVLRERKIPARL